MPSPKLCLTSVDGYITLRVIYFANGRSYNTYHRLIPLSCFKFSDIFSHPEIKKIRKILKEFPRHNYNTSFELAKDIIFKFFSMIESGELSKLDYSPLIKCYNKLYMRESVLDGDVSEVSKDCGFFHKKTQISSNSSSALDSEFRDLVKRERESGFSLIKKTVRRRRYPDKEFIEYTADFTRTSLPFPDVKKEFFINKSTDLLFDKFLIISDLHIPYHDKKLIYSILSMCEYESIKNIVINGDLVDFDFISSYERNSGQLSQEYIEESLHEAQSWINLFSERFDKKIYIDGNHDERLRRNTLGDGIKAFIPSMHPDERMKSVPYNSVAGLFLLPIKGFECYNYGDVCVIGNYQIHHGEETGKNIVKDRVYYNSVIGHTHRSEVVYNPVYEFNNSYNVMKKIRCGCLLDLKSNIPAASQKAKENWVNGFSVLTLFNDNTCNVENIVCDYDRFVYRDKVWNYK